jgi:hypothetical protein
MTNHTALLSAVRTLTGKRLSFPARHLAPRRGDFQRLLALLLPLFQRAAPLALSTTLTIVTAPLLPSAPATPLSSSLLATVPSSRPYCFSVASADSCRSGCGLRGAVSSLVHGDVVY